VTIIRSAGVNSRPVCSCLSTGRIWTSLVGSFTKNSASTAFGSGISDRRNSRLPGVAPSCMTTARIVGRSGLMLLPHGSALTLRSHDVTAYSAPKRQGRDLHREETVRPSETLARRQTWANNVQDWLASDDNTNLTFLTDAKLGPFANRSTGIYKCPSDRLPAPNGPHIRTMSMNCLVGNPGELTNRYNPLYVQFFKKAQIQILSQGTSCLQELLVHYLNFPLAVVFLY